MCKQVEVTLETGTDATANYNPCLTDRSYGASGSVLKDLIHRTSHAHQIYKHDNTAIFTILEEAARSTHFINTIQPFKRGKNGRGAWLTLLLSHVGNDKWESITKINSAWLITTKWNRKK